MIILRFSALGTIPRRTSWWLNALFVNIKNSLKYQANFDLRFSLTRNYTTFTGEPVYSDNPIKASIVQLVEQLIMDLIRED